MSIHVAIIRGPYLDAILSGEKTIESRLSVSRGPAFERVSAGERVYFKQTSGPFRATALVRRARHLAGLNSASVATLRREHNAGILGDAEYWRDRRKSRYATLVWLEAVEPIVFGPDYRSAPGFHPRGAWFVLPRSMCVYPACLASASSVQAAHARATR